MGWGFVALLALVVWACNMCSYVGDIRDDLHSLAQRPAPPVCNCPNGGESPRGELPKPTPTTIMGR